MQLYDYSKEQVHDCDIQADFAGTYTLDEIMDTLRKMQKAMGNVWVDDQEETTRNPHDT